MPCIYFKFSNSIFDQDPKRDLNPNANVFKSKFSNDGSEDGNHENTSDPQDPIGWFIF